MASGSSGWKAHNKAVAKAGGTKALKRSRGRRKAKTVPFNNQF